MLQGKICLTIWKRANPLEKDSKKSPGDAKPLCFPLLLLRLKETDHLCSSQLRTLGKCLISDFFLKASRFIHHGVCAYVGYSVL